jgi:hypothetical protein
MVFDMRVDVPGNTLTTASELRVYTGDMAITNTLDSSVGSHFYSFSLQGSSNFNIYLDGLSVDTGLELIKDTNTNSLVDKDEIVAFSYQSGTRTEINTLLDAGTYYIKVYVDGIGACDYRLGATATPVDYAANTLNINNIALSNNDYVVTPLQSNAPLELGKRTYTDWVGTEDKDDYYQFQLDTVSNFNLVLNRLTADADVELLSSSGNVIASSLNGGTTSESISRVLDAGIYHVRVYQYSGETFYNLELSAKPNTTPSNLNPPPVPTNANNPQSNQTTVSSVIQPQSAASSTYIAGTLRGDTFTYNSGYSRTVYSGNGNVDFGSGARDLLDLSGIYFNTVTFNYTNTVNGGVVFNPGNGNRVFDAITLNNGAEILFEGIEAIKFADTTVNLAVTPNDPLFNQQWNLHMTGIHNAWRFSKGASNTLIGITDTGLKNDNNSDIRSVLGSTPRIRSNYLDDDPTSSHGSSVQSTIASISDNGVGISGINWYSDVEHIDVVGDNPDDYDLASATQELINLANSRGSRLVVNLSLSGGYSTALEQLIANNQGNALFVFASGNGDNSAIASPADLAKRYGNVIAVGSVWGTRDWYNNPRNPGDRISYSWWGSSYGEGLTLMAPSEFVTNYNDKFNGTSASTANVTGIASLVMSVNPNLTATQTKDILSQTAYDLGASGYDLYTGHGLVNADAAIRRAIALARGVA